MSETVVKTIVVGNPLQSDGKVGAGRYTLKKILGRGGMGMVWLAHDEKLNELVALKFISGALSHDPMSLAMLRREVGRTHRLTHPNVLRVHDLHEHPGEDPFIAMEYVDGSTLAQLRAQKPQRVFPWSELAPVAGQLCDALAYAHEEGVVHRDLKPANLMLDSRGRLKLADFGISATYAENTTRLTGTGQAGISGTPAYMSPQQVNGERPAPSDDLYALGATLFELLTSEPPFARGDVMRQVLEKEPTTLRQRLAELKLHNEVPAPVETAILACLAKDAAQRPKDVRELATRLGVTAGRPARPTSTLAKLVSIAVGVAAALALVAILLLNHFKARPTTSGQTNVAPALAAPGKQPQWRRIDFTMMDEFALNSGTGESYHKRGELLYIKNYQAWSIKGLEAHNMAVRTTVHFTAEMRDARLGARSHNSKIYPYARLWGPTVELCLKQSENDTMLKHLVLPVPLQDGDDAVFQFAAIGSRMFVWVNDRLIGDVNFDDLGQTGHAEVDAQNALFKNLDYLDLDSLSEAEALKFLGLDAPGVPLPAK